MEGPGSATIKKRSPSKYQEEEKPPKTETTKQHVNNSREN